MLTVFVVVPSQQVQCSVVSLSFGQVRRTRFSMKVCGVWCASVLVETLMTVFGRINVSRAYNDNVSYYEII